MVETGSILSSGPLIQMFLGWKILTDTCSPLKILWEVVSDCVTYKIWSMFHLFVVGNELNYRLCKIQGNLTNFSATFGLYYSALWSAVFEWGSGLETRTCHSSLSSSKFQWSWYRNLIAPQEPTLWALSRGGGMSRLKTSTRNYGGRGSSLI